MRKYTLLCFLFLLSYTGCNVEHSIKSNLESSSESIQVITKKTDPITTSGIDIDSQQSSYYSDYVQSIAELIYN